MTKLSDVTSKWNMFACAGISAEYNTWETVDLRPVAEELIKAIEKYVNEIEEEKELKDEEFDK